MWDKLKTISSEKAKSYLFTSAYHTMIDYVRKDKKIAEVEDIEYSAGSEENSYSDLNEVYMKLLKSCLRFRSR